MFGPAATPPAAEPAATPPVTAPAAAAALDWPYAAFGAPGTNFRGKETFKKFTPKATLSFKPNPDSTLYASYSQGFKSGGFDMRGDAVAYPDTVDGYDAEIVDGFEVGLKGTLFTHTQDQMLEIAAEARRHGVDLLESFQPLNPNGCWDWGGYEGEAYATQAGPQVRAVRSMIADLLGEPAAAR